MNSSNLECGKSNVVSDRRRASFRDSAWASAAAGLAALAVAIGIGRFAFTPILPMMQADLGLTVAEAGWLATANYVGYLAGALCAIGMRVRPTAAIRAGLVIIGVSTLAMALEPSFTMAVILRAVAGVASALVLVFLSTWALERLALLGRSNLSGIVYAGVGAGIVIAGGVCLVVMSVHAHAAEAWLSLGGVSIAITALIWPLVIANRPHPPIAAPRKKGSAVHGAEYWRLVLSYGAFGFGYIIPATFLPAMARQIVPDPRIFGWAWPVFGIAAVLSTVFIARLNARFSHKSVWMGGHLVMALGVVLPLIVPGLPGILLAALLVGGTFMVITMAGIQEARRAAGARAQALVAAMTAAFAVGQILGPLVVGLLAGPNGNLALTLTLAAAMLALSALALLFGKDKGERP